MTARILVVEDDPMLAASLRRTLRYEGYEVDTVEDGLAAVDGTAPSKKWPVTTVYVRRAPSFVGVRPAPNYPQLKTEQPGSPAKEKPVALPGLDSLEE